MKIHEEIRLINKLLLTGDFGTVEKLKIDKDFFSNKECRDAYEVYKNIYKKRKYLWICSFSSNIL